MMPVARSNTGRVALALALFASGCVHARVGGGGGATFPHAEVVELAGARVVVAYGPEDAETVEKVVAAVTESLPRIAVWGTLEVPVEVRIYPDHEALEIAVGRRGYSWLRAWARYDEILLQSPRTFDLFERGAANLAELLTHELTHCLMYQQAASREAWRAQDRTIPIWFREGMASYTARQGHRRLSEGRLSDWRARTGKNPLADASGLYQNEPEIAYAAAHWAFAFLVERYGADSVRKILRTMRSGHTFPEAFVDVLGIRRETFEAEYVRYLDWGGWIDRRRPRPSEVLEPRPGA
jgi:hypothetical protein